MASNDIENYKEEIKLAEKFLNKHKEDQELRDFLSKVRKANTIYSQKWSMIFDYMYEHYKNECMNTTICTGLTYLCE